MWRGIWKSGTSKEILKSRDSNTLPSNYAMCYVETNSLWASPAPSVSRYVHTPPPAPPPTPRLSGIGTERNTLPPPYLPVSTSGLLKSQLLEGPITYLQVRNLSDWQDISEKFTATFHRGTPRQCSTYPQEFKASSEFPHSCGEPHQPAGQPQHWREMKERV